MTDPTYQEIDLWVREELSQHGEWLIDRFIEALKQGGHVNTGDLADSFNYQTGTEGGAQTLTVSFLTYGRLAEVRSRRSKSAASAPASAPAGSASGSSSLQQICLTLAESHVFGTARDVDNTPLFTVMQKLLMDYETLRKLKAKK